QHGRERLDASRRRLKHPDLGEQHEALAKQARSATPITRSLDYTRQIGQRRGHSPTIAQLAPERQALLVQVGRTAPIPCRTRDRRKVVQGRGNASLVAYFAKQRQ